MNEQEVSHEPDSSDIVIEPAVPEDAEAIMTIKRARWNDTYINEEFGITPEDMNKKFSDEKYELGIKNWQKGIAENTDKDKRQDFVAKIDGKVVGYTSPCIEVDTGRRRLGALYIAKDAENKGVGAALIQKAIGWHGRSEDIYLHVVSYNERAIKFYEKFGFRKNGVEFEAALDPKDGSKLLPEEEMVLKAEK